MQKEKRQTKAIANNEQRGRAGWWKKEGNGKEAMVVGDGKQDSWLEKMAIGVDVAHAWDDIDRNGFFSFL